MVRQIRLTELVSRSLDQQLSQEQQSELQALIERDIKNRKLRNLMFAIHSMVSNPSEAQETRMPSDAKERLRQRIHAAVTQTQTRQQN